MLLGFVQTERNLLTATAQLLSVAGMLNIARASARASLCGAGTRSFAVSFTTLPIIDVGALTQSPRVWHVIALCLGATLVARRGKLTACMRVVQQGWGGPDLGVHASQRRGPWALVEAAQYQSNAGVCSYTSLL